MNTPDLINFLMTDFSNTNFKKSIDSTIAIIPVTFTEKGKTIRRMIKLKKEKTPNIKKGRHPLFSFLVVAIKTTLNYILEYHCYQIYLKFRNFRRYNTSLDLV